MFKYKLTLVEERTAQPSGAKAAIKTYHEECLIGYFSSEEALAKWAEQNKGELDKN